MTLSKTQIECLEWLADDSKEYGCPGGRRTLAALRSRGLAKINHSNSRWEITDVGRLELGPIFLTASGTFKQVKA